MIVRVVAVVVALVASVHCFHSVMNLFLIFDSFLVLVVDLLIESLRGYDVVPTKRKRKKRTRKREMNENDIKNLPVEIGVLQITLNLLVR